MTLSQDSFSKLNNVRITGVKTSKWGAIELGGKVWTTFDENPNEPVELQIRNGQVVAVQFVDEKGEPVGESVPLPRRPQRNLTPHIREPSRETGTLHGLRLDEYGGFYWNRRYWFRVTSAPNAIVDVDVENGIVIAARLLDGEGHIRDSIPMARIYSDQGEFLDSFYSALRYIDSLS